MADVPLSSTPQAAEYLPIPEDRLIDPVAIQLAISGRSMIRLTRREQAQAVRLLEARGYASEYIGPSRPDG